MLFDVDFHADSEYNIYFERKSSFDSEKLENILLF